MFNARFAALALSLTVLMPAAHARVNVINFEDIECARTNELCGAASPYEAKGLTLSYTRSPSDPYYTDLQAVGKSWRFNVKGSIAMNGTGPLSTLTLAANDQQAFSAYAIDLAELNGDGPATVVFLGVQADGSQVRHTVKLDGKPGWQRVHFPLRFSKIVSLSWQQGDVVNIAPHMFDNIVVFTKPR
ncbi:MAG: hypothetical protein EOP38_04160 [Rubrivivax sp.]|nr:MAG: hypothetical protein EOP38_04160 [Rubrivivax sp.]